MLNALVNPFTNFLVYLGPGCSDLIDYKLYFSKLLGNAENDEKSSFYLYTCCFFQSFLT